MYHIVRQSELLSLSTFHSVRCRRQKVLHTLSNHVCNLTIVKQKSCRVILLQSPRIKLALTLLI
jgi:hypothetical protein